MWFIYLFAMVGLIASAIAHFSTYAGVDPQEAFPAVWLLHVGIFVVWIPALMVQNRLRPQNASRDLLGGAPRWMRLLTGTLFAYALLNFIVFLLLMPNKVGGSTHRNADGTYTITKRGEVVYQMDEAGYHHYRALEVRGFSGHWMLFYSAGMTMVAAGMRAKADEKARHLPAVT